MIAEPVLWTVAAHVTAQGLTVDTALLVRRSASDCFGCLTMMSLSSISPLSPSPALVASLAYIFLYPRRSHQLHHLVIYPIPGLSWASSFYLPWPAIKARAVLLSFPR